MSPLDHLPEHQRAFSDAEQAWARWRKSPLGDPAQEASGELLLQAFMDAMSAYQAYAREQTAMRRHNAAYGPSGASLVPDGVAEAPALRSPPS